MKRRLEAHGGALAVSNGVQMSPELLRSVYRCLEEISLSQSPSHGFFRDAVFILYAMFKKMLSKSTCGKFKRRLE